MDVSAFVRFRESLVKSVSKTIIGKDEVIESVAYGLLSSGHILFEDNPGLGKTTLAKAVAKATGCEFKRIQFTADLLPADVTGTMVLDAAGKFRFLKGPVFSQVLLADEINRAPPKTQSALLEAMQEHQVTSENQTLPLPRPFVVLGTQNPIEYEGTYPLPEAQMDRFSMRIKMGYPGYEDEVSILRLRKSPEDELREVFAVSEPSEVISLQAKLEELYVDDDMNRYMVKVASLTRAFDGVDAGVSPRGIIHLSRLCKARAACSGRDFITPDDVKILAVPALAHRLVLSTDYELRGLSQEAIVQEILEKTPVPKVTGSEG
ncbi:MAG TPA: MoxR family ATPase [Nitrososphaerales archaeon]|nr:MoxR family ATPase [Nitrososphaerales archaeon]